MSSSCRGLSSCWAAEAVRDPMHMERHQMVKSQLRARGIHDAAILSAFEQVPRHHFVAPGASTGAYGDHPLPIGEGQTISQPYIVAFMLQALRLQPDQKVLEVGAGCGYQTALLAHLGLRVHALEIRPQLAAKARRHLQELKIEGIDLRLGDGTHGWPEPLQFDAIVVAAAAPIIPQALLDQLSPTGRLIMPVGAGHQELILVEASASRLTRRTLAPVRFVPLLSP